MTYKSYVKIEIENAEKNGYKLYRRGFNQIGLHHVSKLMRAKMNCKDEYPDAEIKIILGKRMCEGREWAIVYMVNQNES